MRVLGLRHRFKVEGDSMLPTLKDGDIVLIDPNAKIAIGDIVVADHPYKKSVKLIKRIESIDASGRFVLKGDNIDSSTDSRTYGSLREEDVKGKVTGLYKY